MHPCNEYGFIVKITHNPYKSVREDEIDGTFLDKFYTISSHRTPAPAYKLFETFYISMLADNSDDYLYLKSIEITSRERFRVQNNIKKVVFGYNKMNINLGNQHIAVIIITETDINDIDNTVVFEVNVETNMVRCTRFNVNHVLGFKVVNRPILSPYMHSEWINCFHNPSSTTK